MAPARGPPSSGARQARSRRGSFLASECEVIDWVRLLALSGDPSELLVCSGCDDKAPPAGLKAQRLISQGAGGWTSEAQVGAGLARLSWCGCRVPRVRVLFSVPGDQDRSQRPCFTFVSSVKAAVSKCSHLLRPWGPGLQVNSGEGHKERGTHRQLAARSKAQILGFSHRELPQGALRLVRAKPCASKPRADPEPFFAQTPLFTNGRPLENGP